MVEEGTEGVRIMTVHRAKGLEFPVVILADLTCNETVGDAHRWVDPASRSVRAAARRPCAARTCSITPRTKCGATREEAARLLYVAATRARDLLVVPVVGDERPRRLARAAQSGVLSRAMRNGARPLERRAARMSRVSAPIASSYAPAQCVQRKFARRHTGSPSRPEAGDRSSGVVGSVAAASSTRAKLWACGTSSC